MDKKRILNLTIVLDKLEQEHLTDELMNHLDECFSSSELTPKIASNQISIKSKISNLGIPSLYREYNQVTAGWLDRFRKKWDKRNTQSMPNVSWESVLNSLNNSIGDSLREMGKMSNELSGEWESIRADHQFLREKSGDLLQGYQEVKNQVFDSNPEHKKALQDMYFRHLDDKFSLLHDVALTEQPTADLIGKANSFSNEISKILRTPSGEKMDTTNVPTGMDQKSFYEDNNNSSGATVENEGSEYSMPKNEQDILNEAWDNYWSLSDENKTIYLNNLINEDPIRGYQLNSWIEQYG